MPPDSPVSIPQNDTYENVPRDVLRCDMAEPWYRTTRRWGQTNLTEIDPQRYDRDFWTAHWRRSAVQGVIVNAGGIVAYYPSDVDLHYRAERLGDRDLFGEIAADARKEGLALLARMDCNRALPEFYQAHPDWFVVRSNGEPVVSQGRYVACVNSPYYHEHIPRILSEVIDRYRPDGFTDNSWTGVGASIVCHCRFCNEGFAGDAGASLPSDVDWDDPVYRRWIRWSYSCRMANWKRFNDVCRSAGGPDCLWLGMVNANPFGSHLSFADLREIGRESRIIMCDHQSRDQLNGFEQNAVNGALLHAVSSDDTIVPESMAHYVRGPQAFRRASMPQAEVRAWMLSGLAGGISPWWHHVGAAQEDRRQFDTSVDLFEWHRENERWLYGRTSIAEAGLVWSHENVDFYGRDDREYRAALPWRGFTAALTRARVPFTPVHADDIPDSPERLRTIILPDVAVLSDEQCSALVKFAEAGGGVLLTGRSGSLDIDGVARSRWPFETIAGARPTGRTLGADGSPSSSWEEPSGHCYLRLSRAEDHPPSPASASFAALLTKRFADTELLPFGGSLPEYEAHPQTDVAATFVPPFPIYPPEFSWMRNERTNTPALAAREVAGGGRVVLIAADIDRQYARLRLPDHGDLLACALEWAGPPPPVSVSGPGYLSCHAYLSDEAIVVHIVNLTAANQWPGYLELCPSVGPLTISVRHDLVERHLGQIRRARFLVAGNEIDVGASRTDGPLVVVDQVTTHEAVVLSAG